MGENIYNYNLLDNESMASSITSPSQDLSKTDSLSLVAIITGSPTGTFQVEFANNDNDFVSDPDSVINVAGITKIAYEKPVSTFDKIRCVFNRTGGSGTLTVRINGRGDAR